MLKLKCLGRPRPCGLIAFVVWTLAGCGGDDLAPRYGVSGQVTRLGKPLTKGTISFLPVDAARGRAATGEIQPDGSYTLMTQDPGDGAMAGDYLVTVTVVDVDDSKLERMPGGMPRLDQPQKVQVKSLIPSKFSDPSKTDLKAKVEPHSNSLKFDLVD